MGFGAIRRAGSLSPFVVIALMIVTIVLSLNYWTLSKDYDRLLEDLADARSQVKKKEEVLIHLEKRSSDLIVQVSKNRKRINEKASDYNALDSKLQTREVQFKICSDEKMKLQDDFSAQISEIQRLNEQVEELKQELMRREDLLLVLMKNSTFLEKKLQYESLHCRRQITRLKEEFLERRRSQEEEAAQLKLALQKNQSLDSMRVNGVGEARAVREHSPAASEWGFPLMKGYTGNTGGLGVEENYVGKVQFALKKPAMTREQELVPKQKWTVERVGQGRNLLLGPPDARKTAEPHRSVREQVEEDRPKLHRQDEIRGVPGQLKALGGEKADSLDKKVVDLQVPPNQAKVQHPNNPSLKELQYGGDGEHPKQHGAVDPGKQHQAIDVL